MRARIWLAMAAAAAVAGCGVPIGGFYKPPSSVIDDGAGAVVSGIGDQAFLPQLELAPQLTTGEQDLGPDGVASARGLAGTRAQGEPLPLSFAPGTAAQVVVAGPPRSDLVLTFDLAGQRQRIDGDPLSPDLSVESFVLSTERAADLTVRVTDFSGEPVGGLLRWYAFLLPSSAGRVSSPAEAVGPAGTVALPGVIEFTAEERGRKLEVIVVGSVGMDLSLNTRIGERSLVVNEDPQSPDHTVEGFVLEVDDPADVAIEVTSLTGGAGDVRWAVVPLPPEDRARRRR